MGNVRGFDPLQSVLAGQKGRTQFDLNQQQQQAIQLQNSLAGQATQPGFDPSQNLDFQQLSIINPQGAAQSLDVFNGIGDKRKQAYFDDMRTARQQLERGDISGFTRTMDSRINTLNRIKGDPAGTLMVKNKVVQEGDIQGTIEGLKRAENAGIALGFLGDEETAISKGKPAGLVEFEELVKIAQNPNATQKERDSANRKLGNLARVSTSAEERISQDPLLAELVADFNRRKEAAKEAGKLGTQFKLKPKVEAAVASAVANANQAAELAKTGRSNQIALNVYNTGMKGVIDGLSNTETGPFVGWLPALTANQQIADGAVAALAPVLKQMFRAAGEGIFTDKDQELLLDMAPKRTDRQASITAKLNNIDAIVRAKLNLGPQQPTGQPTPTAQPDQQITEGQTATNAQGEKIIFRNGQWVPL
ncbi:hypothetical protein KAR91_46345 [Candidatus Pacearchaeota archaeon]|nr:hypothetical protein [Candidatus Pacearchaeota archaeon]